MKRILITLILAIVATTTLTAQAQSPATTIEQLVIDIWPDYDAPSVLVLLTGTLPASTVFPAQVTVPVPTDATVNAVARISPEGEMMSLADVDDSVPGQVTFTTPDAVFRVEYYFPYQADGNQRDFTFSWQSDLAVDALEYNVQQPAMATEINLDPAAVDTTSGQDGLQYHHLPMEAVPAGMDSPLEVSYTMANPQLSFEVLSSQPATPANPDVPPSGTAAASDDGFNWVLVLAVAGGILIVAAVAWLILSSRSSKRRPVKPRPARSVKSSPSQPASSTAAKFCHNCGNPLEPGDRFCRECGTKTKST
jgi:hypothetical protein